MRKYLTAFTYLICFITFDTAAQTLETEELRIYPIAENVWVHVSYLETDEWGKVACNGMIYQVGNEVSIFDTPITNQVSAQLMQWVEVTLQSTVAAVIVNHHHIDCLGGLQAFHQQGIPSYGYPSENEKALNRNGWAPKYGIGNADLDTIMLGEKAIINYYPGPAHTQGSIISYLPESATIFGGCQVKSMGAGKGNLNDADTLQWPNSIRRIKEMFPDTKQVIPGHGNVGNTELLDYTINLFSN